MAHLAGYVMVGILIGLLSGLFGVGGSSVGTPILKMLFGLPDLVALASPLPVTVPTAVAGAYSYWRRGLVRRDVAFWATLGGLPGVVAGALGTRVIGGSWLMSLTGAFVLAVGLRLMVRDRSARSGTPEYRRSVPLTASLVGLAVGFLSGLLANGGGFLLVPAFVLQQFGLRPPATYLMLAGAVVAAGGWVVLGLLTGSSRPASPRPGQS